MNDKTFIDELLAESLLCRFALNRSNGPPYIRPMWFFWENGKFTMTTPAGTLLSRIAKRNSVISLCIDKPTPPYAGVVCEGRVEVQGSLGPDLAVLQRMAERYLPPDRVAAFMEGPLAQVKDRMRMIVHPRSWTIWNMDASARIPIRSAQYVNGTAQ